MHYPFLIAINGNIPREDMKKTLAGTDLEEMEDILNVVGRNLEIPKAYKAITDFCVMGF